MQIFQAAVVQHDPPTTVTAVSVPRRGSQYAVLLRQVKRAGLLERRTRYYLWRIAVTVALLAGGWLAVVLVGDSWRQLAVAAFLAIVFTQVGFLAYDAGHKQIFTSGRADDTAASYWRTWPSDSATASGSTTTTPTTPTPTPRAKTPTSRLGPSRSPPSKPQGARPVRPPRLPLPEGRSSRRSPPGRSPPSAPSSPK